MFSNRLFDLAPNEKLIECHYRLRETFRLTHPDLYQRLPPLEMLILAVLSARTNAEDAQRAFDKLQRAYPDWQVIYQVPTADIQRLIITTSYPEIKAPRLQAVLQNIDYLRGGILSLDHLHSFADDPAMSWLVTLPGVRCKTAACVLMMSTMQRRVLPVDTGLRRVMARLGMMSYKVGWDAAHPLLLDQLPLDWDAVEIEIHHDIFKKFARTICTTVSPKCNGCPLADLCRFRKLRSSHAVYRYPAAVRASRKSHPPFGQLSLFHN